MITKVLLIANIILFVGGVHYRVVSGEINNSLLTLNVVLSKALVSVVVFKVLMYLLEQGVL